MAYGITHSIQTSRLCVCLVHCTNSRLCSPLRPSLIPTMRDGSYLQDTYSDIKEKSGLNWRLGFARLVMRTELPINDAVKTRVGNEYPKGSGQRHRPAAAASEPKACFHGVHFHTGCSHRHAGMYFYDHVSTQLNELFPEGSTVGSENPSATSVRVAQKNWRKAREQRHKQVEQNSLVGLMKNMKKDPSTTSTAFMVEASSDPSTASPGMLAAKLPEPLVAHIREQLEALLQESSRPLTSRALSLAVASPFSSSPGCRLVWVLCGNLA
jgi:hypothetical protein